MVYSYFGSASILVNKRSTKKVQMIHAITQPSKRLCESFLFFLVTGIRSFGASEMSSMQNSLAQKDGPDQSTFFHSLNAYRYYNTKFVRPILKIKHQTSLLQLTNNLRTGKVHLARFWIKQPLNDHNIQRNQEQAISGSGP